MASIAELQARLWALSECAESQDLHGRAKLVAVALNIASATPQFLSDLYDVSIESIATSGASGPARGDGAVEANAVELGGGKESQLRATCAAAALHYLSQQGPRAVQQFLDDFFLPLLARPGALPDKVCRLQACAGLTNLLISNRHWQQLRQLVDACLGGLRTPGAGAAAQGAASGSSGAAVLPLPVCCTLLTVLADQLSAVVGTAKAAASVCTGDGVDGNPPAAAPGPSPNPGAASGELLRHVLTGLRAALRPMLTSLAPTVRQAALKSVLLSVLTCAKACGGADLTSTAQDIWVLALDLLGGWTSTYQRPAVGTNSASGAGAAPASVPSGAVGPSPCSSTFVGTAQQRTALALLVAASSLLLDPAAGVDVHGCERFWELLRGCLALPADVDALERKRALLLFQRLAPPGQLSQPGWALWAALYDILDEFPIHLVAPMWAKIDQLHAPAPEYRTEAVVPKSYIPRKKDVKQRKGGDAASASSDPASAAATGGALGGGGGWAVPLEWQCVLWTRALQHGNIQVQRLAMRTLLQRDWRADGALLAAPPAFVAGVILPSLTREHHYRGGGAEADVMDVQAAAASWLHAWFAGTSLEHRMEALLALRSVVVGSELSRLGLQQLMRCVAAGARGAAADGAMAAATAASAAAAAAAAPPAPPSAAAFPGAMLAALRAVLVYMANFTGLSYKRSMWQSVLTAAAAVAPVRVAGLGACLRLLLELPPSTLEPGGELRDQARAWLLDRPAAETSGDASTSSATPLTSSETVTVTAWLKTMLDNYWSQSPAAASPAPGGDASKAAATPAADPTATTSTTISAAAVAQLLLLFVDVEAACTAVVKRLQQALYGTYARPYQQAGEVDRALTLLRELLAAVPPLPLPPPHQATASAGTLPLAPKPPPAAASVLQLGLLDLVRQCCEDICAAASNAADAFLEADSPAETAGGLVRSEVAWSCVALALLRVSSSQDAATAPAVRRLAATLLALLTRLGRSPLPAQRYEAVVAGLKAATTAAEAVRASAAWSPAVRSMALERLDASALAAAVLRDAAAAIAAATSSSSSSSSGAGAPSATGSGATGPGVAGFGAGSSGAAVQDVSQILGEVEAAKWPLLDAATACDADGLTMAPPMAGGRGPVMGEGSGPLGPGGGGGGGAGGAGAAPRRGLLRPEVAAAVLSQSVGALSEYPEGQVLPLLRCLRRCWAAVAAEGPEAQAAAAAAVGADPTPLASSSDGGGGPPSEGPLESLCWPVVRALWNALCATPRRTGPLCAAFVNTALMPCLYVRQSVPVLRALHGPDGPCRWLLSRLLEWGGTSSRFLLLLACQLGSFLPLQPALVECYSREIQTLLLWGSRKGSSYDPEGSSIEGAEAEEVAAVAAPPDPSLVTNPAINTEVAPRVALLCCIHQLAETAGCVWPPPPPAAAPTPTPALTSSSAAAAAAAGVGGGGGGASVAAASSSVGGPGAAAVPEGEVAPKRPVIVFGDSSFWDEQAERVGSGATADTAATVSGGGGGGTARAGGAGGAATGPTPSRDGAGADADADAHGREGEEEEGRDYGAPPPPDPSHPALHAGRLLWRQLLEVGLRDPLLSTDKVRNGSELHRQKVRLWQSLVVLTNFVPREECGPAVAAMLSQVNGNNPPTVKQYIEAVVAALVLREPALLQEQLLPLLSSYSRHISGLGSYILIAAQVLLHSPPAVQRRQLRPLLLAISPWLMCHGHNVRTYAQLIMWALLHRFPPESPLWAHSIGDLGYLRQILFFMTTNVDLVRLRRNIGDPILEWSPAGLAHPARVFASSPEGVCLAGSPIEQATFEGAPATLVDRVQGFLVSERHRLRNELEDRQVEREFSPQDPNKAPAAAGPAGPGAGDAWAASGGGGGGGGGVGDFQRKIIPEALLAALEGTGGAVTAGGGGANGGGGDGGGGGLAALLEDDDEEEAQDWKSASGCRQQLRHEVLLVASLIDKLPNLAGLARTCEVLGAGRLVLADTAVTREQAFASVSVTAEQWLPLEEVKPAALLAWLERKAADGYTLVGLEQTAESLRLPDYRWPSRVVLVLGREKEGIPPEVLSLLDATLEIPQRGIIRSLNVHVSGAIALYEYVRQMQQQV